MTSHNNSTQSEEATTVEEQWVAIFESHGVNRNKADLMTKAVFGVSQISKGHPSKPEIRDIVEETLHDLEYEDRLDEHSDAEEVRDELLSTLDSGLVGTYIGPLSAPDQIAFNTGDDDGTSPVGAFAEPEHGLGNAEPENGTSPDDGEVAEIRDFLEDIIEDQDLDVSAVKQAAARLDHSETDGN